jgi:uncharacterized protein (DUF433 family)
MTADDLLELISVDPKVCHGQPCVKGTRVLVTVILDELASGMSAEQIVGHHPSLSVAGVGAAAAYGAWLAKQEVHVLPQSS